MPTSWAPGTSEAAELVCSLDPWVAVQLDGALTIEVGADRVTISVFKKVGLNLATLPSEALHTLQDGVITELRAREQWTLNVINEQKVNNAQMFIEKTSTINLLKKITEKNECTTTVVDEAYRMFQS